MAVPNIFGSATSAIPLSQLDTNFATPVTIGNTAVQLGNTVTSFGNVTLTNVTISSGNVTITGANVSGTANVSTLIITGNQTSLGNVSITGNVSANIATFGAGSNTAPAITTTGDTNTGIFFPAADTIAFSEGGVEAMRIDSSGNVGIGTASPDLQLQVEKTSASTFISVVSGTANTAGLLLGDTDSATIGRIEYDNSSNFMALYANAAERMRIDSSGNVGIGGNSSSLRLFVKTADAGSTNYSLYVQNSTPADLLWVRNDGVFNTGNAPSSPYNANVGAVRTAMIAANGQLGYNASTRNTKTNITPLTSVNWLFDLEPVSFNYREKDDEGNYTDVAKPDVHYGLIAEDTETVNKELCFYNADGSLAGIDYNMLAPALLKCIQEQQALITALTARITAQDDDIAALKAKAGI